MPSTPSTRMIDPPRNQMDSMIEVNPVRTISGSINFRITSPSPNNTDPNQIRRPALRHRLGALRRADAAGALWRAAAHQQRRAMGATPGLPAAHQVRKPWPASGPWRVGPGVYPKRHHRLKVPACALWPPCRRAASHHGAKRLSIRVRCYEKREHPGSLFHFQIIRV